MIIYGIIFGIVLGFSYYIRIHPSRMVNRAIYILFGITPIGFGLWILYMFINRASGFYLLNTFGVWGFWIHIFVQISLFVIGAFIGDFIGKRRYYKLPFNLNLTLEIDENNEEKMIL